MEVIINYSPEYNDKFEQAIEKALRLVGGRAERAAKEMITDMEAVDTGFLRNSITYCLAGQSPNIESYTDDKGNQTGEYSGQAPEDDSGQCRTVYVGTNVYYAPYVEYGTRKMVARPFLSNSIQANVDNFRELFIQAFEAFS